MTNLRCGFVKPGSSVDIITKSGKNKVMNLTNRDVIVFWGGANDVGKRITLRLDLVTL
jgi:hypothetical protein